MDDTLKAGSKFTRVPEPVMELLRRSYQQKTDHNGYLYSGFEKGEDSSTTPFQTVLERLEDHSQQVSLLMELFLRLSHTPAFWPLIYAVGKGYRGTSSGFSFVLGGPRPGGSGWQGTRAELVLYDSPKFCADLPIGQLGHQGGDPPQPRQCYRELCGLGVPGVHICIVPYSRQILGGWHDMHIDPHQCAGAKTKKCHCWYGGLTGHFQDVGRWICNMAYDFLQKEVAVAKLPLAQGVQMALVLAAPSVRNALVDAMFSTLISSMNIVDSLENLASGDLPLEVKMVPGGPEIIRETLGRFKEYYMNNV